MAVRRRGRVAGYSRAEWQARRTAAAETACGRKPPHTILPFPCERSSPNHARHRSIPSPSPARACGCGAPGRAAHARACRRRTDPANGERCSASALTDWAPHRARARARAVVCTTGGADDAAQTTACWRRGAARGGRGGPLRGAFSGRGERRHGHHRSGVNTRSSAHSTALRGVLPAGAWTSRELERRGWWRRADKPSGYSQCHCGPRPCTSGADSRARGGALCGPPSQCRKHRALAGCKPARSTDDRRADTRSRG